MAIPRARSADELYAECRDHDLVLVPDPPLAGALNRRLERPRFGPFAVTPRRLAAGGRETAEDAVAFLEVVERTDLPWKDVAFAIGNVLQCWEHRGEAGAVLEYEAFATPATEAVLECLRELTTTSSRLAGYEVPGDEDVAVVGLEEFSPLERSVLPDEYDEIDPFVGEPFDRPPFRIFDSPAAIVDAVLDSVTAENADRVAVVLDRSSRYSPLVESALEAADVPFHGGPGFADQPDHRAFLRLLRTAHAGSDVRIADVRPVLERLGAAVDVEHDDKRLHAVDLPAVDWLTDFADGITDHTFETALEAYERAAGVAIDAFREELDALGLLGEPVTGDAVDRLQFYVQTFEVPVDREDGGVLLADATAAATVDRPAVFYLGLDEGWTHASPRRPWVDRDAEYARHLHGFQRLLQNGVEQYYFVLDEAGGRAVTPCPYFEELLDEPYERFSDLESVRHARTVRPNGDGFDREPLDVEPEPVETVSQSGLNALVNCPRDYLFGRLVDGPDRDYFAVGNLFHDFAECYVAHPGRFDDDALDAVVEFMLETTRPFDRDVDEATNRTRYRVGLETIVEFLDSNPPAGAGFLAGGRGWWTNAVADHLGLDVDAPHTEWWFDDADLGLKGKIDLVRSPTELVDYKSGRRYSAAQVVGRSALDPPHDTPNFQALSYLAWLRSRHPDERLQFTFFHFLETLDDVVAGEASLDDCLTTVTYRPVAFEEYVTRAAVFDELCEHGSGDCRKTFEPVDHGEFVDALREHPFPDGRTKAELLDSPLGEALHRRASRIVGEYEYVRNGCGQALAYLRNVRDSNFFADDLDAFEEFVAERLDELNRYRAGEERFPVAGLGGEPNYRRVDHRDMLFEGDA